MFNDRLMSPVDRVTIAFMPSGVMSTLTETHRTKKRLKYSGGRFHIQQYGKVLGAAFREKGSMK